MQCLWRRIQKLLHALLDPEVGVVLAQASGCAPANSACYDDSRVCDDTLVQAMRTTAEIAVPMPNIPEMDVMWTVVSNLLTDVNQIGGRQSLCCRIDASEQLD